jgi:hypothetical protein
MRRFPSVLGIGCLVVAACAGGGSNPSVPASSATPDPTLPPSPVASAPTTPSPTPPATGNSSPRPSPGTVLTIVVPGTAASDVQDYVDGVVFTPDGSALRIDSKRPANRRFSYELRPGDLPAGTKLSRLDLKVCGTAKGDFWEIYGPDGADPYEIEVGQPEADGCWHFNGGTGDGSAIDLYINGNTHMRIDRLVYTVTVG